MGRSSSSALRGCEVFETCRRNSRNPPEQHTACACYFEERVGDVSIVAGTLPCAVPNVSASSDGTFQELHSPQVCGKLPAKGWALNRSHLPLATPQLASQPKTAPIARRYFLGECGVGLGSMALASLLADRDAFGAASRSTAAQQPHFQARAKHVIFLFMAGGPSQLELFDNKPQLRRFDGQQVPAEVIEGFDLPFIERDAALMSSPLKFSRYGESGAELSETLPHLAEIADDIAIVKSIHTDAFNHAPAQLFLHTGHLQLGKPSMGSWTTYGLGNDTADLPAFVVLGTTAISGGAACFDSGFLPTVYQGVPFRSRGAPVLFVDNPVGVDARLQRDTLDTLAALNRQRLSVVGDPEIAARISAYELSFRLQASAPELMDITREPATTLEMYGAEPGKPSFANQCLLARRLVERGVRFVEVALSGWDHHSNVGNGVQRMCQKTDQASAALVKDLKQRGLLDDTVVIWGGEFGRTPMAENNPALGRSRGRDHHPNAYAMWFAGGGVQSGQTIGETDDMGYHVVEDPVHIHDVQATVLHLLGMNHTKLTFRHQGRDVRLTDVGGHVIKRLIS